MSNQIILLGGGGHAKSLIEVIEDAGIFKIIGILDDNIPLGNAVLDYQVIGRITDIDEYYSKQIGFVIAIGHIQDNSIRKKLFEQLTYRRQNIPNIVSPKAHVSYRAKLDIGSQIMSGAYIGPNSKIGKNTIINTHVVIEHDSDIGDNCHIGPGCVVIGNKVVYDNIFVGANSTVIETIKESGIYVGNPVKKL